MILRSQEGYTLLEALLAVSIIVMLTGFSVPVLRSFQEMNSVGLAADIVASTLRRAQGLARAVSGDEPWGVKVSSTTAALFQGSSFAARNSAFDEVYDFSQIMTVSGTTEFVFSPLYGYPSPTGSLELISPNGNSSFLTINEKGVVIY